MNDVTHRVVVATVLLCLVAAAIPSGGATTAAGDARPDPLHSQVKMDRVKQVITVQPDGDAKWTVNYIVEIGTDQNESEAFDELAADIERNPDNYTDRFASRIRSTVRTAENATGREMRASNFEVSTRRDAVNGIITYSFEWSNFGNVSAGGDRILVGDAISGFFLNTGNTLQIQWLEGWTATSVAPDPDSSPGRSVVWRGETTDFGPGQPEVVVERVTDTPTGTETTTAGGETTTAGTGTASPGATDTSTGTPTTGAGPTGEGGSGLPMGILALIALVVVGGGVAWWRRPSGGPAGAGRPDSTDDGPPETGVQETSNAAEDGEGRDHTGADDDIGDTPVAEIDEELLSNEERVLRLLEERGGRMKQQEVVDALDWTEAKTSQVVSGMRDDGAIDSFRLGRENVLTLPDEEIDPTGDDESMG